jgi:hypothetical protein
MRKCGHSVTISSHLIILLLLISLFYAGFNPVDPNISTPNLFPMETFRPSLDRAKYEPEKPNEILP